MCVRVCVFGTYLPGYVSVVPGVALQVRSAQLQLLLQLLPQFLRRRLQPELVLAELEGHHRRKISDMQLTKKQKQTTNQQKTRNRGMAVSDCRFESQQSICPALQQQTLHFKINVHPLEGKALWVNVRSCLIALGTVLSVRVKRRQRWLAELVVSVEDGQRTLAQSSHTGTHETPTQAGGLAQLLQQPSCE